MYIWEIGLSLVRGRRKIQSLAGADGRLRIGGEGFRPQFFFFFFFFFDEGLLCVYVDVCSEIGNAWILTF